VRSLHGRGEAALGFGNFWHGQNLLLVASRLIYTVRASDVHKLNPQIPLSLHNVVRKVLAHDSADRYADARRMSEELGGCGIKNSWTQIVDPAGLEVWQSQTTEGLYELRVVARPAHRQIRSDRQT
jgi:hypothetical protein